MAFGLCHACSPSTIKVYKWVDEKYQDYSSKYPDIYQKQLEQAKISWKNDGCDKSKPPGTSQDYCTGDAVRVLLTSDILGKREEGWKFFWVNTDPEKYKSKYGNVYDSLLKARETLKKQFDNKEPFVPSR